MNLEKIVSITGKPGLYRIIAETPKRIIVENLEDSKKKLPVSTNFQIALLDKITIFTTDNSDLFLKELFDAMEANTELQIPDGNTSPAELRNYFRAIAPKHDENRVYASDLKKIVKWYHLLNKLQTHE
ncbi:hypothetical protein GC194_14260 [bacterium]|nr:hypothetical protein [bacterium]